jgi:hypothetical protein
MHSFGISFAFMGAQTFMHLTNQNNILSKLIDTERYSNAPNRNGCPGIPTKFDVSMQQVNYTVAVLPPLSICSGSQNAARIITSNVPGTSFFWSFTTTSHLRISRMVSSNIGYSISLASQIKS